MMNNKIVEGETSQPPDEGERIITYIPEETLRSLFRMVVEFEFDRWMKESGKDPVKVETPYNPSANNMKLSAPTFITVLQAVDSLRRAMSIDIISQHHALNLELKELLNKMATIVGRTYIELGDGAEFADDEALLMIRDLLLAFDSRIIHRTRFRKITDEYKSGYGFGKNK